MNDISIITLPPTRWQEYKTLRLEALQNEPTAFMSTYAEIFAKPDDYWQQRIKESTLQNTSILLFAEHNGKLVGMASASLKDNLANIHAVYVSKKYRSIGVATKLIVELITLIAANQQIKIVELGVSVNSLAAISLYKKLGFKLKYECTASIGGQPQNCIVMQKDINTV